MASNSDVRSFALYDGREMIGSVVGASRDWQAMDVHGNVLAGSPFKSEKAAIAAVNLARPNPCVPDARLDNTP